VQFGGRGLSIKCGPEDARLIDEGCRLHREGRTYILTRTVLVPKIALPSSSIFVGRTNCTEAQSSSWIGCSHTQACPKPQKTHRRPPFFVLIYIVNRLRWPKRCAVAGSRTRHPAFFERNRLSLLHQACVTQDSNWQTHSFVTARALPTVSRRSNSSEVS